MCLCEHFHSPVFFSSFFDRELLRGRSTSLENKIFSIGRAACGVEGGDYSTNIFPGRLRPDVQPLTLFGTIFYRKCTLFLHLPLKKLPFSPVSPFGSEIRENMIVKGLN